MRFLRKQKNKMLLWDPRFSGADHRQSPDVWSAFSKMCRIQSKCSDHHWFWICGSGWLFYGGETSWSSSHCFNSSSNFHLFNNWWKDYHFLQARYLLLLSIIYPLLWWRNCVQYQLLENFANGESIVVHLWLLPSCMQFWANRKISCQLYLSFD